MNILTYLKMIEPIKEPFIYPATEVLKDKILKYSYQFSSTSGIIRFFAKPGEFIKKGQPVARIYNAFGKLQETLIATNEGIVLGHSDYLVAFPGAPVISFGVFD